MLLLCALIDFWFLLDLVQDLVIEEAAEDLLDLHLRETDEAADVTVGPDHETEIAEATDVIVALLVR
jgi:hypothetical protein